MADRFEDERGVIDDILVTPLDSVTRIRTVKGAIRGNHIHRETTQWTYVLSGALLIVTNTSWHIFRAGELAIDAPGVAHAWQAVEDTEVLVFTKGPRSGRGYETDTVRLEVPLLP